jgi:hypothetical protein
MYFVKYIFIFAITNLLLISLVGCFQPQIPQEELISGFKKDKSIVIMPKYYNKNIQVIWNKKNDNKKTQYFNEGFAISDNYIAFLVDAGKYYIQSIRIKSDKDVSPKYLQEINSTLNNTVLYKTPQKERVDYIDKNFNSKSKTIDIKSYYEFAYDFSDFGTISISDGEIVLIPLIWADIKFYEDSCKVVDKEEDIFLIKIFNSTENNPLFALLDAGNEENGFYTWIWLCKTDAILVTIKTNSINTFLASDNIEKFLKLLGNKQVITRDFEFGQTMKDAKKMPTIYNNIEQYAIYGNK